MYLDLFSGRGDLQRVMNVSLSDSIVNMGLLLVDLSVQGVGHGVSLGADIVIIIIIIGPVIQYRGPQIL